VSIRPGVRLAIDVGRARVGIARSDPEAIMAVPVETVARESAVARMVELVGEYRPLEVVVGLPLNLAGDHTASTTDAIEFAREIHHAAGVPVRLVDERLSTVGAAGDLRRMGISSKSAKPIIDQASAVIILQHCLDSEKSRGEPPGYLVGGDVND
jgi:putative Holliday junction resolvase